MQRARPRRKRNRNGWNANHTSVTISLRSAASDEFIPLQVTTEKHAFVFTAMPRDLGLKDCFRGRRARRTHVGYLAFRFPKRWHCFQTRESPLEAFARQRSSKLCDYTTCTSAKFFSCVKRPSMADGPRSFKIAGGCSYSDRAYQRTVKAYTGRMTRTSGNHKVISYKTIRGRYEKHKTVLLLKQIDR